MKKKAVFCHYLVKNGNLWVRKKFYTLCSARDDLVKVSLKSDARKCQNQVTSPYFDQLSESTQPLCHCLPFLLILFRPFMGDNQLNPMVAMEEL